MDVKISKDIDILKSTKACLQGGHILAVYAECDRIYVENMLKELVRDYKISKKILPSNTECTEDIVEEIRDTDDDVRLIIVMGGYHLIDAVRIAATMLGINYMVVQLAAMRMLDSSAYVFRDNRLEIRHVTEPKMMIIDTNAIMRKGNIEYMIGDMSEILLDAFDSIYMSVVSNKGIQHEEKLNEIISIMNGIDEKNTLDIIEKSYQLSLSRPHILSTMCNELAYHDKEHRDMHIFKFGIAYMLLLMYRAYIKYDGDDLLYPPDVVDSARILHAQYGLDISTLVLGFKMMGCNEFMRITHIAREYRKELIEMLDRCIVSMRKCAKVYRRVARDAGYKMNEGIRMDDLLRTVSVFSIQEKENTPLRIMKIGGFLEKYIA